MRDDAVRAAGARPDPDPTPPGPSSPTPSPCDPFDAGPLNRLRAALHWSPPPTGRSSVPRAFAVAAVAWVPLLVLCALQGHAMGPTRHESFLLDVPVHARYLLALPLLIASEPWCLPQLAAVIRHFHTGMLVAPADVPRWDALIASARRLLDHRGLEVVLAVVAYAATALLSGLAYPRSRSTWVAADGVLTLAGWWRAFVSQPLFLLCVCAWLWRVCVWTRLLWGISRLDLRLLPAHPDLSAGLRFVAVSLRAWGPVSLAFGAAVAGTLAGEIIDEGRRPQPHHATTIVLALIIALLLFAGPLMAFVGPLHRARVRGILQYGALAAAVGHRFEERWLRRVTDVDSTALAASDFSATADMFAVASNVRDINVVPVGLKDIITLVLATLIPFVPLVFLVMPLSAVIKRIAGVFF